MKQQQQGFTLIELIVVIVILGILAATALPKFADLGADARLAKMQGARAALQASAGLFHATWLAKGSPTAAAVQLEGVNIPYQSGYPDVGGDGPVADVAVATSASGIALAAGNLSDYTLAVDAAGNVLTVTPDATHATCSITYTEGNPPTISAAPAVGSC